MCSLEDSATHILLRLTPALTPAGTIRGCRAADGSYYKVRCPQLPLPDFMRPDDLPRASSPRLQLTRLAVVAGHRKHGFGRVLTQRLHEWARADAAAAGKTEAAVVAHAQMHAIPFYERCAPGPCRPMTHTRVGVTPVLSHLILLPHSLAGSDMSPRFEAPLCAITRPTVLTSALRMTGRRVRRRGRTPPGLFSDLRPNRSSVIDLVPNPLSSSAWCFAFSYESGGYIHPILPKVNPRHVSILWGSAATAGNKYNMVRVHTISTRVREWVVSGKRGGRNEKVPGEDK